MKDTYCYIEFEFYDLGFNNLQKMFLKLKEVKDELSKDIDLECKQNNPFYLDPVSNHQWKDYLDDKAIAHFNNTFDFNSPEGIIYWQLWEITQPEIRLGHPFFKTPGNWDFECMLDAIFNGYYCLIDLIAEKDSFGCLYYQPTAYPFGGSNSLVELIISFGNKITYNSRHKYMKPTTKSLWNYELAKELVAQKIGFSPRFLHEWKTK